MSEQKNNLSLIGEHAQGAIYDEVFRRVTEGYCIFDADHLLTSYSASLLELYPSMSKDISLGMSYRDWLWLFLECRAVVNVPEPDDITQWVQEQIDALETEKFSLHHELHDGRWVEVKYTRSSAGQSVFVVYDVSEQFRQRTALMESRKLFKSFATLSSDWFWELDENLCYTYHSEHKAPIYARSAQDLLGLNRIDSVRDSVVHNRQYHQHNARLRRHETVDVVLECRDQDGAYLRNHVLAEPRFHNGEFIGYIGCGRDVTQEHLLKEKLNHLASHDDLTKLVNRRAFEQNLENVCRLVTQKDIPYTLCFIDLDRFKLVNDSSGHEAGDYVLKSVATLFVEYIGNRECIARLGGDEFAMILQDDVSAALRRVETIIAQLNQTTWEWNQRNHSVGASAGLVAIDKDIEDISDLLSRADAACYDAKNAGRNQARVYIYDEYYQNPQALEIKQVNILREAMENDDLRLFLQPLKAVNGNPTTQKYEVLLRLLRKNGEAQSAGVFIPVAEKYDLMRQLDQWVLERALEQLTVFHQYNPDISFAINLSGNTLSDRRCLAVVEKMIEENCPQPEKICFEITETAAIRNLEDARYFVSRIRQYGCRFALDDFGAGLSSFSYLKSLPADYLKIDGTFVRSMKTDPTCRAIVSAFNQLSHEMGMQSVAEFVEDKETETILRDMGIDYVQGYGVGEPRPVEDWAKMLLANAA